MERNYVKASTAIKSLKNGQVSLLLTPQVKITLKAGIENRMEDLNNSDLVRLEILSEVYQKLEDDTKRVKVTRPEFICLFERELISKIPEHLQALIYATLNPKGKRIILQ